ncbi:hypothetical protein JCM16358_11490 [Halanaerocella petrolearia]
MKKTKKLLQKLDERIENIKSSEDFKKMLEFFSRFHQYSFRNQALIEMQKPDATYVAGYKQWQEKFDRHVKKGEEGIAILAPQTYTTTETEVIEVEKQDGTVKEKEVEKEVTKTYFKTVYVFDISQTEGEPIPELDISIEDSFGELLEPLKEFTASKDIELEFKSFDKESFKGYSKMGKIVINDELNKTEQASTLVHELGHELLHDNVEKRFELTKEIKEMEAEAISFVILNHYGVETKSDKYLALYKESYDLQDSLKRIHEVSTEILDYLNSD